MEATADYYATLGVEPKADGAAIRAAYRNLMRRYHPDVNASEEAVAKATAINEAYACLGDGDRRAAYDRERLARQTHRTAQAAARRRPAPAQHARWHQHRTFAAVAEPEPPPPRVKAIILGLALLVTLITFAMTSATPPPMPVPEEVIVSAIDNPGGQKAEVKGYTCVPDQRSGALCTRQKPRGGAVKGY